MKKLFTNNLFLLGITICFGQNWQWARSAGSDVGDGGYDVLVSTNGNIYAIGGFNHSITFDSTYHATDGACFVVEFNQEGFPLESALMFSADINSGFYISRIFCNNDGEIFIPGDINGENYLDTIHSFSYYNGSLFKLNESLHGKWVKKISDLVYATAFDKDNNIYVGGEIGFPTSHIDTFTLFNSSNSVVHPKMFLAKLDTASTCKWVKQGWGGDCSIRSCSVNNNNLYVLGWADSIVHFDTTTIIGLTDFVANFDTNGNIRWHTVYTRAKSGWFGYQVQTDMHSNCFVTAGYDSTMFVDGNTLQKFTGSNINAALLKYDSTGTLLWASQLLSDSLIYCKTIHTDNAGNTYVAGYFSGSAIFGADTVYAQTNSDAFITRFNANGVCLGYKTIQNVTLMGITQDSAANAIVTGNIHAGTTNFDNITLTSNGQADFFLAKLDAITGTNSSRILIEDNRLIIYPNPNKHTFTIQLPEALAHYANAFLQVYDNSGQKINEQNVELVGEKLNVDIGTIDKGIYSVLLTSGHKKFTGRVVIE